MGCLLPVLIILVFAVLNDQLAQGVPRKSKSKTSDQIRTNEPVIGILMQEATGKITKFGKGQYLLNSYVKFIESAGGRVVPFRINQTPQEVEKLFNSINGFLLPGGHVKLQYSKYATVGKQILELAKKANDKGSVFPIWAECLGLELIALLVSGRGLAKGQYDTKLFSYTFAKNMTAPLKFSNDYSSSRLFGRLPPDMVTFMTTRIKSWNNHNKALTPARYKSFKGLSNMFRVLSTNKDMNGVEFLSTMEGKKYPFFLFHWHPTKAQAPTPTNIDSSQESIMTARFLISVFINLARMSDHAFPNEQAKNAVLIHNYRTTNIMRRDGVNAYFMGM